LVGQYQFCGLGGAGNKQFAGRHGSAQSRAKLKAWLFPDSAMASQRLLAQTALDYETVSFFIYAQWALRGSNSNVLNPHLELRNGSDHDTERYE
jgi:hypothetical protein